MKKLRVTVNGKVYDVIVEVLEENGKEVSHAIRHTAPSPAHGTFTPVPPSSPSHAVPKGPGNIESPFAGRVISISVQAGQTVTEGEQLMLLEAMKMNNYIYAPRSGRISAIHVKPGDAVEEGQLLLTLS
ncbi:MAG: biotin/lipoyl-containing protein [Candidatus Loosdrechtia sp.]|uniref:biotin/lipoyl-containing protein n=1 Tax=Candidatus Loosdrechtia sp. TaxID=3101272 RepID=UPI003A76E251|nr:MAG: biotin/lipoyl-containing protein [Candidatus Jettenia sp. AMX2]